MQDGASENVALHSSRLQPSIFCMTQLQPWCSTVLVLKFTSLRAGMKALRQCLSVMIQCKLHQHEPAHLGQKSYHWPPLSFKWIEYLTMMGSIRIKLALKKNTYWRSDYFGLWNWAAIFCPNLGQWTFGHVCPFFGLFQVVLNFTIFRQIQGSNLFLCSIQKFCLNMNLQEIDGALIYLR